MNRHQVEPNINILFFIRTREFWLSLSVLIVFPNFRLICSYFVLVTIIIFDLALYIFIFIIHAEYFWYWDGSIWYSNSWISKVFLSLCILFIHCSFVSQILIDLIYFSPLKFFWSLHPAWSLFLNCSYFLGDLSLSVLIKCVLIKKAYYWQEIFPLTHLTPDSEAIL